jgi:hypothetical protein
MYLGNDLGIMRLEAALQARSAALPLPWAGMPALAVTGDKASTHCVDHNEFYYSDRDLCEYDGKVSVTTFGGHTLVYTRSNRRKGGGARHVQVTRSRDGRSGWSPYKQLIFDGDPFSITRESNIYHFTVRPLNAQTLLAVFPATFRVASSGRVASHVEGGVYASVSSDGVRWAAPRRLFASTFERYSYRISHSPVDGDVSVSGDASRASVQRLLIEHGVDLREAGFEKSACRTPPLICSYRLDISELFRDPPDGIAIAATVPRVVSDAHTADKVDWGVSTSASSPSYPRTANASLAAYDEGVYRALVDEASMRTYLGAVYPAARTSLQALDAQQVREHFESLDFYYTCPKTDLPCKLSAFDHLMPSVQCTPLSPAPGSTHGGGRTYLPYLPPGVFYHASRFSQPRDYLSSSPPYLREPSFLRHPSPLAEVGAPLRYPALAEWYSSFGARLGPQPSWTSPVAHTRYVLHPVGLSHVRGRQCSESTPCALLQHVEPQLERDSLEPLNLSQNSRVARMLSIADGEYVEVENWGGWTLTDCPRGCGLWANIWKGTGIAMRVRRPFAALNTATAIVGMLQSLGARNHAALWQLAEALHLAEPVAALQREHSSASLASCVASALLLQSRQCPVLDGSRARNANASMRANARERPQLEQLRAADERLSEHWQVWQNAATRMSPGRIVRSLMEPQSFEMHWLHGVCGIGQRRALLATLACLLRHQTILLVAASNDNGLLHQELVDFEVRHTTLHPNASLESPSDPMHPV